MASGDVAMFQQMLVNDEPVAQVPDLSHLSAEQHQALMVCTAELRSAMRRAVNEIFVMGSQLVEIRQILGKEFFGYTKHTLGLNYKTVQRCLNCHAVMRAHFVEGNGQLMLGVAENVTAEALNALSPQTDVAIIDEVKRAANDGEKVNIKFVNELVARHVADREAEFKANMARADANAKALARRLEQAELDTARLQREADAQTKLLRRKTELTAALEQENKDLRSAATEVRYEEKRIEVVPAGYATAQEAIAAKEAQLAALTAETAQIEKTTTALKQELGKAQETFNQVSVSANEFRAIQEQFEALLGRFPLETLKAVAGRERTVKTAYQSLGENLVQFGQQLIQAGA